MDKVKTCIEEGVGEIQKQEALDRLLSADTVSQHKEHRNLLSDMQSHISILTSINECHAECSEIPAISSDREVAACNKLKAVVESYKAKEKSLAIDSDSDDGYAPPSPRPVQSRPQQTGGVDPRPQQSKEAQPTSNLVPKAPATAPRLSPPVWAPPTAPRLSPPVR